MNVTSCPKLIQSNITLNNTVHNILHTVHASTQNTTSVLRVNVLADAQQAVGVLEEHFLQRDHHALEVRAALLDVVTDLQCIGVMCSGGDSVKLVH